MWLLANQILDYGSVKSVKFTIGDDNDCEEMHSKSSNVKLYCNGPLKPDTWYEVRMRGFTNGGYSDSEPFLVKTSNLFYYFIYRSIIMSLN